MFFFFFTQKTAYEMRISDWSSDVCSSDLFAAYFGATNLAERVHRIRRRRDHQRSGDAPQPGGLEAVLVELREAGVTFDELAAFLPRLSIEPVFTAHPPEVVRRALPDKEHTLVESLVADIDRDTPPPEPRSAEARIRQVGRAPSWERGCPHG